MHIPVAFALVGSDGRDLPIGGIEGALVEGDVIHLRKRRHVIRFAGVKERPALSLNRGFSAPVTLAFEQSEAERAFLARHDRDPFCRWQAYNSLLTDALMAAARLIRGGREPDFPAELAELAASFAANDELEPAFRALALALPGESDIARELGSNIDPDAIFGARERLAAAIASANAGLFTRIAEDMAGHGAFRPDAAGAGRRALRNVLIDYSSIGEPALATAQFRTADNMTDRAAALTILAHRHPERSEAQEALAMFEARYRSDPIVLDKWFQIQATIPGPRAVERVSGLMRHPAFSIANPNRVRSLAGTFATANQTGFHRPDGAGYEFFADVILEVEARNPQIAARLATAFRSWRSMEPIRRDKARQALLRISSAERLSADLRDIVERTLA